MYKIIKENDLDCNYKDKLKDVSFEPIFIMGLHRSGTSILYKMLNETGNFSILTSYHVLNYDQLIYNHINKIENKKKEELNNLFLSKGITTRKTDNVKVNADYAYEYMYIFSERKYKWKITENNNPLFVELCKKLKYVSENNKPILLKNPYDYANFLLIKKLHPYAKFVFIQRNPVHVISSTMNLWKTNLKSKNEYLAMHHEQYSKMYDNPLMRFGLRKYYLSRFPPGIFEVINRCAKGTDFYLNNINSLRKEDYVSIKYEDLCKNPNENIRKILDLLKLKSNIDFNEYIKPRKLNLSQEVKFLRKYIYKKMEHYFKHFNYEIEDCF